MKRLKILKNRHFVSILISVFVLLALQTNLFNSFKFYISLGFSSEKKRVSTEKRVNSKNEAVHFLLGILSGYTFDTWLAALAIGCTKEIYDFGKHYSHHSISQSQIIHDGIVDPLFWTLGGFVGCFSLETFRVLLRKSRKKKSTNKLSEIATAIVSAGIDKNSRVLR